VSHSAFLLRVTANLSRPPTTTPAACASPYSRRSHSLSSSSAFPFSPRQPLTLPRVLSQSQTVTLSGPISSGTSSRAISSATSSHITSGSTSSRALARSTASLAPVLRVPRSRWFDLVPSSHRLDVFPCTNVVKLPVPHSYPNHDLSVRLRAVSDHPVAALTCPCYAGPPRVDLLLAFPSQPSTLQTRSSPFFPLARLVPQKLTTVRNHSSRSTQGRQQVHQQGRRPRGLRDLRCRCPRLTHGGIYFPHLSSDGGCKGEDESRGGARREGSGVEP
jgi:hypothetical protein